MVLVEHLLEKEFGEPEPFLLGLIQLTQRGESFTSVPGIAVVPQGEGSRGFNPPREDVTSPLKLNRRSTGPPNPLLGVCGLDGVGFHPNFPDFS